MASTSAKWLGFGIITFLLGFILPFFLFGEPSRALWKEMGTYAFWLDVKESQDRTQHPGMHRNSPHSVIFQRFRQQVQDGLCDDTTQVLYSCKEIPEGTEITADELALAEIPWSKVPPSTFDLTKPRVISSPISAVGGIAAFTIPKGSVISWRCIMPTCLGTCAPNDEQLKQYKSENRKFLADEKSDLIKLSKELQNYLTE